VEAGGALNFSAATGVLMRESNDQDRKEEGENGRHIGDKSAAMKL
jgi:hypothetical protein